MKYGKEFWNKIKKINIILSIFIVCIHGINLPTYGIESGFVFWIENYIVNGLGKVAVPLFFVLSGLKAYSNLSVTTSLIQNVGGGISRKIKSRIKTLLIPYVIWITITWIGTILPMIIPGVRNYVNGTSSINPSIRSFAITLLTGNDTQLWFLNRLIILSLLMPVIFVLMKNKWAAIVMWLALLIANCILSRNDTDWLRVVFDYMTGVLIALHFKDKIRVHNSHHKTYLILFSIFGICETYIFVCDRFRYIEVFVLFAMMMALWRGLNEQSWNTEDRSFWLYLSHGVVFVYVKKIVYLVLPKTEFVALTTYFVLTAGIILLLIGIAIFIEKTIPNLYVVMVGGRTNNKK